MSLNATGVCVARSFYSERVCMCILVRDVASLAPG
ncbi:hypothetical protein CGRA01v4_04164 [Colletotrichum graminicola]|nr:hypothetical protein CGRA01v4_04164 [Colletotrichum graminicola]